MSRQDFTIDDIEHALRFLDCEDTDVWLRAGMAIKSEFGESGFGVWDAWSQGDSRYREKEARARWKSFKGGSARGSVSIGTILHLAFERGFKIERPELTPEQKAEFAKEQEARRKHAAEQAAMDAENERRWYDAVASVSQQIMPLLKTVGSSPYLGQKKISACGCLFPSEPFLLDFKADFTIDIVRGNEAINSVFTRIKSNKAAGNTEADAIVYVKRGSILIPMFNELGELRNFQIIYNDGKSKRFLTNGQKSGLWFLIASPNASPEWPLLFCEGFATGASEHMATGWPVVVTFDAGNMPVVAEKFKADPRRKIFAGDNDWETALDPKKKNSGLVKAREAAVIAGGVFCVPEFVGDATGLSDFNDLHVTAGLAVVREQLTAALDRVVDRADESGYEIVLNHDSQEREQSKGEAVLFSIEDLLVRFHFIVPTGQVWDSLQKRVFKKGAFADFVGKPLANDWRNHSDRTSIDQEAVSAILSRIQQQAFDERAQFIDPWKHGFVRTDKGEIKADIGNAKLVLTNDPSWEGVLGYCDFSYRVLKRRKPPFANSDVGEWTDSDTDRLRIWLAENYRFTPKTADALGAVVVCAEENRFHPVREYLRGLKWDGVSRLERWLHIYMGADHTAYSALVGKKFLIGAVARVMRSPVKMDNVLIFEGLQGIGKSTALRVLAGEWFTDTPLVLGDKDSFQQIQGVWLVELAELDSLNKAENTRAKQFFGSQVDRYRPSYGRLTQTFPRQCVFAGSTNQDGNYLKDPTGNRRYWPVKCTKVEGEALSHDRDQLWAEAVHRYDAGELWWPEDQYKHLFESEQEDRFDADVWEELIEDWLYGRTKPRVLISEIMEQALGLEAAQMKPPEQKRVGQIMAHLGWVKVRTRSGTRRETGYEPPLGWKQGGHTALL